MKKRGRSPKKVPYVAGFGTDALGATWEAGGERQRE
jgi:hypothetical protein